MLSITLWFTILQLNVINTKIWYFGHISSMEARIFMKFENYVQNIVLDHQPNFHKDPCKDARARGEIFQPFLNWHQKKLFYSLLSKYYESSETEYLDSTSFLNRWTPLISILGVWNFFEGLKGGFPKKISTFFCFSPMLIY